MKDFTGQKMNDLLHEFLIFAVFGLSIALPLVIYNLAGLITDINISHMINGASFSGIY